MAAPVPGTRDEVAYESKSAPPSARGQVQLGCDHVEMVTVRGGAGGGEARPDAPGGRRGLALRGADAATGRRVVWMAGEHRRVHMPAAALTRERGPTTVPLPCEVAVWVLQGGGHDAAVLAGYESATPHEGAQAMAVPWGRVGHGDGTVIDAARRLLFEQAGAMTGPDEVFRVAHFDCAPGETPDGGAAARVVLALHAGALTEVLDGQAADGTRLDRPAMREVGRLADWESQGQRMTWGVTLAMRCLGEGARSHAVARELLG